MNRLRYLLGTALLAAAGAHVQAQVDNYALRFSNEGIVNLGQVGGLTATDSYTLQFWFKPDVWTPGAALVRCGSFSITLGTGHKLLVSDGNNTLTASAADLTAGAWNHVTLRSSAAKTKMLLNNTTPFYTEGAITLPTDSKALWLGGDFRGEIDEVRLWNGVLPADYNGYWRTTLNALNPSWESLVGYWKMDQNECTHIVDYKGSHHGTATTTGVSKVKVDDNSRFKYLTNIAYSDLRRFSDRKIDREKYALSNHIHLIGAHIDLTTGRATLDMEREDAVKENGATWESEYGGRKGVIALSGGDAALRLPASLLGSAPVGYAFEAQINLTEWTEGAILFSKGEAFQVKLGENNQLKVTVNGTENTYPLNVTTGSWFHLGVSTKNTQELLVALNGEEVTATTSNTLSAVTLAADATTEPLVGKGLKGRLDDVMVWKVSSDIYSTWSTARSLSEMKSDAANGIPYPDDTHTLEGQTYKRMDAAYSFDTEAEYGYDYFSVQHFMDIIRSFNSGKQGCRYIVTAAVNTEQTATLATCLTDPTTSAALTADLIRIANDDAFDGVDLDIEWAYSNTSAWTGIGTICSNVRAALKEGKELDFTPHKVSYAYPTDQMDAVDHFAFQIYGPSDDLFNMSSYTSAATTFLSYGYSKDKTILSFATTSSRGTGTSVQGYRSLYEGAGSIDPSADEVTHTDGNTYKITGFDQTVERCQYVVDNDLGGIMYWDMGNDLPSSHTASLARAASYVINANVDDRVTTVSTAADAPDANADDAPTATTTATTPLSSDTQEAIDRALLLYAADAGYHAANSTARKELLYAINQAQNGQQTADDVNTAYNTYLNTSLTADGNNVSGPTDGNYVLISYNSHDRLLRYLYTDDNGAPYVTTQPDTTQAAFLWNIVNTTDDSGNTTYTIKNDAGYYIPTITGTGPISAFTTDESNAYAFSTEAGNAIGRLQLKQVSGSNNWYILTRYDTSSNGVPSSFKVVVQPQPNHDSTNEQKWTGQWIFRKVDPALLPGYTVTVSGAEDEGLAIVTDGVHNATYADGSTVYLDTNVDTVDATETEMSSSAATINTDDQTIDVVYSGISAKKVYRINNYANTSQYLTFSESNGAVTSTLNENDAQQLFQFPKTEEAHKYALTAQGKYIFIADKNNVQATLSTTQTGYYIIPRGDGKYTFDRVSENLLGYGDGGRDIFYNSSGNKITTWGAWVPGVQWYVTEVNSFNIPVQQIEGNGYATTCLPFTTGVSDDATTAYTATIENGNLVTTPIESGIIPAGTPVILRHQGAATTVTLDILSTTATLPNDNALKGVYWTSDAGTLAAQTYLLGVSTREKASLIARGTTSLTQNSAYLVTDNSDAQTPTAYHIEDTTAPVTSLDGHFWRIGHDGSYLGGEDSEGASLALQTSADNTTLFYGNGTQLVNTRKGFALGASDGNTLPAYHADGADVTVSATANGTYRLTSGGKDVTDGTTTDFTLERVTTLPVAVTAAGYATFYAPTDLRIPEGLTVYTSALNDDKTLLLLEEVSDGILPAQTAVILKGPEGTYDFDVLNTERDALTTELSGATAAQATPTDAGSLFTLQQRSAAEGGIGLYPFNGEHLAGFHSWLTLSADSKVKGFSFDGTVVTALDALTLPDADTDGALYDLSGRRVQKAVKGIYLHNGKKVLVR